MESEHALVLDHPEFQPPPGARVIDTGAARWWIDQGVLCNRSYVDGEITVAHLRDGFAASRELTGGRRAPLIAVAGPFRSASRESRELIASEEAAAVYTAMGVLVGSPVARVLLNLLVHRASPHLPVRIFTSVLEARGWARAHVLSETRG